MSKSGNMGICQKHGEFNPFLDGCPQCLAERLGIATAEMEEAFEKLDKVETNQSTALVKVNPEADAQVITFYSEALKAKEYAQARVIATAEDLKPATDDLSLISKIKRAFEEKRKEYVKPLQDHVKTINDAFKILMEPIETADQITREKMLAFQLKQKLIREDQGRINALRLEAAQKEMKLKGELTESVNLIEVMPEAPKRIQTALGVAGQRDNWKWEVIDINLVPREYLIINAGMLTPIVKASKGKIQITGIRIFNEPILTVNTR